MCKASGGTGGNRTSGPTMEVNNCSQNTTIDYSITPDAAYFWQWWKWCSAGDGYAYLLTEVEEVLEVVLDLRLNKVLLVVVKVSDHVTKDLQAPISWFWVMLQIINNAQGQNGLFGTDGNYLVQIIFLREVLDSLIL